MQSALDKNKNKPSDPKAVSCSSITSCTKAAFRTCAVTQLSDGPEEGAWLLTVLPASYSTVISTNNTLPASKIH